MKRRSHKVKMMKLKIKKAKARNPYAVAARSRRAGRHAKGNERQAANLEVRSLVSR